ncbi:right-handed parallel beta-helix repeat-containing protein [Ideonella sp. DXS29W]|uniref:Right-handed parallel beta-helix repeat-containing protein n=1 Tax=Ideonella lacteola TaxID=2984193 RepID=A0ABU9BZB3_9BURK
MSRPVRASAPARALAPAPAPSLARALALALAGGLGLMGAAPAWSACIASGDERAINAALQGVGAEAVLCPGAVFSLKAPVQFTAADQRLYTEGLPTGATRAVLRVTGTSQASAIVGMHSGIHIESVVVDGARPALGRLAGGAGLIEIGGAVTGQVVRHIRAFEPRGWSALHLIEGGVTDGVPACQQATITDNQIGPAGMPDGQWADGISLACGRSTVSRNTITDATDGGIVIFGAPGSVVSDNLIVAHSRVLLGGINLVDFNPTAGHYEGTLVQGNTIDAAGALIKVGIAMGPAVWGCDDRVVRGATVKDNLLRGNHMGYGYPINGVDGFTVLRNKDKARHVGLPQAGCGGEVSAPAGLQQQAGHSGSSKLQKGYVTGNVHYVLGVTEPAALAALKQPQGCTGLSMNQGLAPGQETLSCDGRFSLKLQNDGNLVLRQGKTMLWSAGTSGRVVAQAIQQSDGNLVLHDAAGMGVWSTGTGTHPGARLIVQDDGNLVIYDGSTPVWSSGTCCH